MAGRKQVYGFMLVIVLILAFNFCRKAIKRDKELKKQRDEALKDKLAAELIEQKLEIERKLQMEEIQRQQDILDKMKEHNKVCYDLFIFSMIPDIYINSIDKIDELNDIDITIDVDNNKPTSAANKKENLRPNNSITEPSVYLFILVLIYFLGTAVSDVSQHYKTKNDEHKNESRRYSLQSYAKRKSSKGNSFLRLDRRNSMPILTLCTSVKYQGPPTGISNEDGNKSSPRRSRIIHRR